MRARAFPALRVRHGRREEACFGIVRTSREGRVGIRVLCIELVRPAGDARASTLPWSLGRGDTWNKAGAGARHSRVTASGGSFKLRDWGMMRTPREGRPGIRIKCTVLCYINCIALYFIFVSKVVMEKNI